MYLFCERKKTAGPKCAVFVFFGQNQNVLSIKIFLVDTSFLGNFQFLFWR